jgi:hypothetical protein
MRHRIKEFEHLARISHEEHQAEWKNNTILKIMHKFISISELQTLIV